MSEATPEPTPRRSTSSPDAAAVEPAPAAAEGAPEPAEPTDDVAALRREAAGWRRRLRDAESERDQLREQLDRRDRADAERLAGERMASASDLWLATQLGDLRGEDGSLSPERVNEVVDKLLAERPHWARPRQSFDGGARVPLPDAPPSFGEALKQAGRP